ncbi:hypothetical protein TNCV_5064871, partial [Trichonephila clavipes]
MCIQFKDGNLVGMGVWKMGQQLRGDVFSTNVRDTQFAAVSGGCGQAF